MATTIPDIVVSSTSYTNIYTATSISVGTSVIIQNKGGYAVFLQTVSSIPSASSQDGVILLPMEMLVVDSGESGLFARAFFGSSKLSIQPA